MNGRIIHRMAPEKYDINVNARQRPGGETTCHDDRRDQIFGDDKRCKIRKTDLQRLKREQKVSQTKNGRGEKIWRKTYYSIHQLAMRKRWGSVALISLHSRLDIRSLVVQERILDLSHTPSTTTPSPSLTILAPPS